MKNQKIRAVSLFLCMLIAFGTLAGCGGPKPGDVSPATSEPAPPPEMPEDPGTVTVKEATDSGEITGDNNERLVTYSVSLPVLEGEGEGIAVINEYYESQRAKYLEYAQTLGEMAKEHLAGESAGTFGTYEANMNFFVNFNKNGYFSVMRLSEEYTGGAHGGQVLSAESFETAGGGKLCLGDLFAVEEESYRKAITDGVLAQISEEGMAEDLLFEDYEDSVALFDSEHFFLTEEGLVIFYQEYEIAPYASGSFSFVLPYEELQSLMKPEVYDALTA